MKKWSNDEIQYLIENYHNTPNEELSIYFNRYPDNIMSKAYSLNLKKIKRT